MKLIIRNFLTLLKRFRLASTLNILGLAVAFAAFTVILMQVNYERGFDKFHSKADRIYRLEGLNTNHERAYFASTHSRPVIDEFIRSSPHIRTGTLVADWGQKYITVERNGAKTGFFEYSLPCFPEIVQIFDFKMIEGDTSVLRKPAYALISSSMAERLYGTEPALDKQFTYAGTTFTVGGVYRDFPRNSQLKNGFYFNFGPKQTDDWGNWSYKAYILLDDPAHKEAVVENHRQNYVRKQDNPDHYATDYRLNLLSDVFYSNDVDGMSPETNGDRSQTRLLLIVAFLVIAIAAINFVNFATALTPMRIKSINTQKVLGSPNSHLRWGLILEAVGISLIAYLIALIIVYLLSVSAFATLITADMTLQANGHLLLLTAGVALAIGFIAGSYPAWYITSFPPALVLKGSFGLSPKGRKFRTVLISIQFIVSIILIISLLFVKLQTHYMKTTPAGYDRDNIAVVWLSPEIAKTQTEVLSNRLKEYAAVEDVTFAHQLLGGSDDYMGWGRRYKDGDIHFNAFPVSPDFLKFMRIHIAEGRDFNASDLLKSDSEGTLVINRTMQQEYGLELGDIILRNHRRYQLHFDAQTDRSSGIRAATRYVQIQNAALRLLCPAPARDRPAGSRRTDQKNGRVTRPGLPDRRAVFRQRTRHALQKRTAPRPSDHAVQSAGHHHLDYRSLRAGHFRHAVPTGRNRGAQSVRRDGRRNPRDVQQDLCTHHCRLLRNRRTDSLL